MYVISFKYDAIITLTTIKEKTKTKKDIKRTYRLRKIINNQTFRKLINNL